MNCVKSITDIDSWMITAERAQELPLALQTHLDHCKPCSGRYRDLTRVDSLVAENAVVHDPNPFLWARLEARLAEIPVSQTQRWLPSWLTTFPSRAGLRLQWALCLLVLAVSGVFIDRQVTGYRHDQLQAQISEQWDNLKLSSGSENPFRLELGPGSTGHENPFPILGDTSPEKNPFSRVKSE